MGKIKILYVHANNYDIGGADYCLFKMTYEMNRLGYETLVLLSKRTNIVDLYEKHGLPIIVKPFLRIQKTTNPIKLLGYFYNFLRTLAIIIKIIKQNHITIVHSNDLLDFSANIAAKITGVVSVQHIRMIVDGLLKYILSKISLSFTNHVLPVSFGLKNLMFTPDKKDVTVLYDWIDIEIVGHKNNGASLREELQINEDIKIIGCVGRLETWKGQHVFIEAAREVLKEYDNCVFIVVGGTVKGKESYLIELKNLVDKNNLREKVFFLGERKDISNLFTQFTFSVHSSIEPDPFPGVVLESLVNECVVIGAADGGVPEELDNEVNGLLYKSGDYIELSEKMLILLKDEDKLNKLKMYTKSLVLSKFEKNKVIGQLNSIYKTLLKQNQVGVIGDSP